MKRHLLMTAAAAAALVYAAPALAVGPPAGVPHGPPASVTMGPPSSVTMGPPSGVTMGPPAGALAHIPQGAAVGNPNVSPNDAQAANVLGNLNAAHASENGLTHASSHSIVGAIEQYKTSVTAAQADITKFTNAVNTDNQNLTSAQDALNTFCATNTCPITDTTDPNYDTYNSLNQAVTDAQDQLTLDQNSLDAANAAVTDAQTTLASASNKDLTPDAIDQINALLGIQ